MEDDNSQSLVAPRKEDEESEGRGGGEDDATEEPDENEWGGGGEQRKLGEPLDDSRSSIGTELRNHRLETLAFPSSHRLPDVRMERSLQLQGNLKNQIHGSHQEALANVIAQAAQVHLKNELHVTVCPPSSTELSPTSVTQSISSASSPSLPEQVLSSVPNSNCLKMVGVDHHITSNCNTLADLPTPKTPCTDGYNWRKYGQKQVKSAQGSRSYYRCTCAGCGAKKIECCEHSNHVMETIYKGRHNHDPPRKVNSIEEHKLALICTNPSIRAVDGTSRPAYSKITAEDGPASREMGRHNSSCSDRNIQLEGVEHLHEPAPKQRVKKRSSVCSDSLIKVGKKEKFVVHAAGDVGISGDGYRWRKYGQKMVKGNPHPRSYYRCTSAGCPVRKQVEKALDNPTGFIIAYKGVHDHDKPVPKKCHGPPSGLLVTAPTSMNNLPSKKAEEAKVNQESQAPLSMEKEGRLMRDAMDLGGDKAIESARTLLSIGFEIKPY